MVFPLLIYENMALLSFSDDKFLSCHLYEGVKGLCKVSSMSILVEICFIGPLCLVK